ncbi:hypothetical protein ACFVFF_23125 [Streptomyces sp. NPDC057680]|uniref:hypothetical protein n=1 Tax=Streptomyces sp. NPDC057680 TaxID=3346208 RepID=UPI0036C10161
MTATPDRPGIDQLTSDMLDELYARLDKAERAVNLLADSHRRAEQAEAELVESTGVIQALRRQRDEAEETAAKHWDRVLKQSRLLQELKRDAFELRMDLISLLDGRLGEIGPGDITPGEIRRASPEHGQTPA